MRSKLRGTTLPPHVVAGERLASDLLTVATTGPDAKLLGVDGVVRALKGVVAEVLRVQQAAKASERKLFHGRRCSACGGWGHYEKTCAKETE